MPTTTVGITRLPLFQAFTRATASGSPSTSTYSYDTPCASRNFRLLRVSSQTRPPYIWTLVVAVTRITSPQHFPITLNYANAAATVWAAARRRLWNSSRTTFALADITFIAAPPSSRLSSTLDSLQDSGETGARFVPRLPGAGHRPCARAGRLDGCRRITGGGEGV